MLQFRQTKTNQEISKVKWVDFRPTGSITHGSPIEFYISGTGDDYMDLKRTRLYLKIQVANSDGSHLGIDDRVGPINLMLHSMFSQVDVSLQNIQVGNGVGSNYSYKAYLDTLINQGNATKKSLLQAQGYFKDRAGMMDESDPINGGNSGLAERFTMVWNATSAVICDLEGPLMSDLCQQDLPLPNGINVRVRLWPSKAPFFLMTEVDKEFKVLIHEAVLKVCKISPSPQMVLRNEQHFSKSTAKYPYLRTEIVTQNISSGLS